MKYFALLIVALLGIFSLLIIFPAPLNLLWRLKIGVTELGFIWALLISCFSIYLFRVSFKKIAILGFICGLFFIIPLLMAFYRSFDLQNQLEMAYGKIDWPAKEVINLSKLVGIDSDLKCSVKTFLYKEENGLKLDLAIYSVANDNIKPLIVSVHGGAWASGDNNMFVNFNKQMAKAGYVVADVNYSLAPDHIFPAQKEDIKEAIQYLKNNAVEFQIDTGNIFLLGRSAGGQIAGVTAFELGKHKIKGLICFYTPHDLLWGYSFPGNPLILDSRKVLRNYLGGDVNSAKANYFAASPVYQVNNAAPPLLLIHGESDEMVAYEHNLRLIKQLHKYKIPYYLLSLPYATHGCDYFANSHSSQLSNFAIGYFLKRYCQTTVDK